MDPSIERSFIFERQIFNVKKDLLKAAKMKRKLLILKNFLVKYCDSGRFVDADSRSRYSNRFPKCSFNETTMFKFNILINGTNLIDKSTSTKNPQMQQLI